MTQINELLPPEIAEEILKGQDNARRQEAFITLQKMSSEKLKNDRNEAYRKIILGFVPKKIHKYILPFEYRFDGKPDRPQPSDIFDIEIPGLPRFSFEIDFGKVMYLLPKVDLSYIDSLNTRREKVEDLSLALAKLVDIQRERNWKLVRYEPINSLELEEDGITANRVWDILKKEIRSSYEPFEDDGPNADPEIDEDPDAEGYLNVKLPETPMNSMELFIQAGTLVTSMADLKKLVREITIEIVGDQLANHIAYFHLK